MVELADLQKASIVFVSQQGVHPYIPLNEQVGVSWSPLSALPRYLYLAPTFSFVKKKSLGFTPLFFSERLKKKEKHPKWAGIAHHFTKEYYSAGSSCIWVSLSKSLFSIISYNISFNFVADIPFKFSCYILNFSSIKLDQD